MLIRDRNPGCMTPVMMKSSYFRILSLASLIISVASVISTEQKKEPKLNSQYDLNDNEVSDLLGGLHKFEDFDLIPEYDGLMSKNIPSVSAPQPERNKIVNPYANAAGRYGMINHNNICYMNSLVTSLFNINRFTETLFAAKPTSATAVMLSEIFYKLQQGKGAVSSNLSLIPAVVKEMDWQFGGFHCVSEFVFLFLNTMPPEFNALFTVKGYMSFVRREDEVKLKHRETTDLIITIHLKYKSLAETLAVGFRDDEAEDYIIDPNDWEEYSQVIPVRPIEKIKIPIYNTTQILNRPEILIFGIDRSVAGFGNMTAKTDEFVLNESISLPEIEGSGSLENGKYILQAFCAHSPGHYVSYVRDFTREASELEDRNGDWYKYNDSNVSAMSTEQDYKDMENAAHRHATLAFYVRSDVVAKHSTPIPEAPERVIKISKLMTALEEVQRHAEGIKDKEKVSIPNILNTCVEGVKDFVTVKVPEFISTISPQVASYDDYIDAFPRNHRYEDFRFL